MITGWLLLFLPSSFASFLIFFLLFLSSSLLVRGVVSFVLTFFIFPIYSFKNKCN